MLGQSYQKDELLSANQEAIFTDPRSYKASLAKKSKLYNKIGETTRKKILLKLESDQIKNRKLTMEEDEDEETKL